MTLVPVKVTAVLTTPLAQDAPHLDSLCELAMASKMRSVQESSNGHRHQYRIVERGQEIDPDAVGKIPIPIARRRINGMPIPLCSSPILAMPESDTASYYTSAFPLHRGLQLAEKERTKIMRTGGRYKSFMLPLRQRLTDRIVWFAALRGGKDNRGRGAAPACRLRKLLKGINHIGKKTAHGHGVVSEWIVERIEDDWSWYASHDSLGTVLMRPLPSEIEHPPNLCGYRRSFGAVHGPYWDRRWWGEILEPC